MVRCKKDKVSTTRPPYCTLPQTSLTALESLSKALVQEVVFLADFRCRGCQKRVSEVMSKMNGETQTVVIGVMEKKVTLTCTYPIPGVDRKLNLPRHQRKASSIAHLFCSPCTFTDN